MRVSMATPGGGPTPQPAGQAGAAAKLAVFGAAYRSEVTGGSAGR